MQNHQSLLVIMGPTASGKSSLAMKVAENLPCEIISADSMQVYRGMDIGTAKPTRAEQKDVKHHLIDILDIHERLDVYSWVKKAKEAIELIQKKKNIPLIVGGSGMYIRALLYGLDPLPASVQLQNELYKEYEEDCNNTRLILDLTKIDPQAVNNFGNNKRKLLRALEVFLLTGKPMTQQHELWQQDKLQYPVAAYYASRERANLYDRIKTRTNIMLESGWIEETESLIKKGLLETPTARQAIGYSIIAKYLENEINYDEIKMRIVAATKRYARRQETWFKNQHPEAKKVLITDNFTKIVNNIIINHA